MAAELNYEGLVAFKDPLWESSCRHQHQFVTFYLSLLRYWWWSIGTRVSSVTTPTTSASLGALATKKPPSCRCWTGAILDGWSATSLSILLARRWLVAQETVSNGEIPLSGTDSEALSHFTVTYSRRSHHTLNEHNHRHITVQWHK